jgi:hypothetical protein
MQLEGKTALIKRVGRGLDAAINELLIDGAAAIVAVSGATIASTGDWLGMYLIFMTI